MGNSIRKALVALAGKACLGIAGLAGLEAHAQLRPEIASCAQLRNDAALVQLGTCSLHVGCNMVLKWHKDCTSAVGFLDKLKVTLAGRRAMTNNDVFDAYSPNVTSDETLKRYVATVQRIVHDALRDPGKGVLELKAGASRVYYEGGINKSGNMQGAGIFINESGMMMRGQWTAGRPGGLGQTLADDKAMFAGTFAREAKLNGNGAFQASNGVVFAGNWINGKQDGRIESTHANGVTRKLIFAEGNILAESPYAPPGTISVYPGEKPPTAVAAAPPVTIAPPQQPAPAAKPAAPESAATRNYPKVTISDLAACKNEISTFHRLEISYLKLKAVDDCTKGKGTHYDADNCKAMTGAIRESSAMSDVDWFVKGNGNCNGTDYPCFGLASFNDNPDEDLWRQYVVFTPPPPSGAPEDVLGEYTVVVDKCIARVWLAKVDQDKPGVAVAQQPASAPGGAQQPVAATSGVQPPGTGSTGVNEGGSSAPLAPLRPDTKSKEHNPVHNASTCIRIYGPAEMKAHGLRSVLISMIVNTCPYAVSVQWCVAAGNGRSGDCNPGYSNLADLDARGSRGIDADNQTVNYAACRLGKDMGFQAVEKDPRFPFRFSCS